MLRSPSGRVRRHKWKDVVTVRLYQAPAPGRPWRHVFEVRTKHERPCRIENAHFAGASGYEDRTAQYLPFVRAALVQLGRSNPRARALVGAIRANCVANVVTSDSLGIPAAFREAGCFAVLGALADDGVPITLARVTGRGERRSGKDGVWTYP